MELLPLYVFGAIAAASLFVVLLGPATGLWVALFYINAVALVYYGNDDVSEKAQDGDVWFEGILEGSLVLFLVMIVIQYTRQQRRNARLKGSGALEERLQNEDAAASAGAIVEQEAVVAAEIWRGLPDAVFTDIISRLSNKDVGAMRLSCIHWFDTATRAITTLRPSKLPVKALVADFPNLQSLDLSSCIKDLNPVKLRHLRKLKHLRELSLGCHHRLIASSVTDQCLAELVALTQLKSLNLSQCVHIGDAGMMAMVYLPNLTSLNISGCVAVTDISIMLVAQLSNLASLEMPWCLKVTNIGLKALAPLTKLTNLNISGCQLITEQGIIYLAAFRNMEKLSLLNLGYSKVCVTDAALARLTCLTKLRSLHIGSMQLVNPYVTDAGLQMIAKNYQELRQLGLMSLHVSDKGVQALTTLKQLQALNLRGCTHVSGACVQYLAQLTGLSDLCLLHNPKLEIGEECFKTLGNLRNLQVLGLGNFQAQGGQPREDSLASLEGLTQLSVLSVAFYQGKFGPRSSGMLTGLGMLQHLDLQGSVHVDQHMLQAVGRLSCLQSLHLSRCSKVDDEGLQGISGLPGLHTLNISNCFKVTDVGLQHVVRITTITHLLAQQCSEITDAGLLALGQLLQLKVLDLSCCEKLTGSGFSSFGNSSKLLTITLNGCAALSDVGLREIGKVTTVTKLDLSNCPLLSDEGVSYLGRMHNLTGLDLAQCTQVGDVGLLAIAASMACLATLKLNGCLRVTDAGVAQLGVLTSLLTLHMDRCVHLSDEAVRSLAGLTGLTSLRMSRCPRITNAGVAALSTLSRLSTLGLAHCPHVTDAGLMALTPLTTLASLEF